VAVDESYPCRVDLDKQHDAALVPRVALEACLYVVPLKVMDPLGNLLGAEEK
jgi:hypothetical protein